MWRNWQTRRSQTPVASSVRVRLPPSACARSRWHQGAPPSRPGGAQGIRGRVETAVGLPASGFTQAVGRHAIAEREPHVSRGPQGPRYTPRAPKRQEIRGRVETAVGPPASGFTHAVGRHAIAEQEPHVSRGPEGPRYAFRAPNGRRSAAALRQQWARRPPGSPMPSGGTRLRSRSHTSCEALKGPATPLAPPTACEQDRAAPEWAPSGTHKKFARGSPEDAPTTAGR